MLKIDKLLLIGSEQRKAGKTTLACKVINKFNAKYNIVAIKITILSEDSPNHNHKSTIENGRVLWENGYDIFEENDTHGKTDTSKFLVAGAKQSFWLRVFDKYLLDGFTFLFKKIGEDAVIICESTSLAKLVKPGIFIMVTFNPDPSKRKKYLEDIKNYTDKMILFDGRNLEAFVDTVEFKSGKWKFIDSNCS